MGTKSPRLVARGWLTIAISAAISFWPISFWISTTHADEVDYLRDIKPLLASHCFACHGAFKQEGGLRLDTAQHIQHGGDSGSAVTTASPDSSLLLQRVASTDSTTRMPPEGKPLSAEQVALLTKWIHAGASGPADEQPQADPRQHWAFQPPQAILPPAPNASVDIQRYCERYCEQRHRCMVESQSR